MLLDSGGKEFKQLEAGTYPAICTTIIDLWTQDKEYSGEKYIIREVLIWFEFPTETEKFDWENEESYTLHSYFSLSLGEKSNLGKFLVGWRWRSFTEEEKAGFDLKNVLWQPLIASVISKKKQDGSDKSVIDTASKLMKGMEAPVATRPLKYFALDEFDQEMFDSFAKWTQDIIMRSPEYKSLGVTDSATFSEAPAKDGKGEIDIEDLPF